MRRRAAAILAFAGCAWLAGCYRYVPTDPAAAPADARVRAVLTPEGAGRLAPAIGGKPAARLEGRLVEVSPEGTLIVEVHQAPGEAPVGVSSRPLFQRVSLHGADLAALELKRLDRTRTAFFIGGSALLGSFLVKLAFDSAGGGSEGSGPGVDNIVVPVFSIRR